MSGFVRPGRFAAPALALFLASAGCGTRHYNDLMGQRLTELRASVKFQGLYAPTALPGTPFTIRVPLEFERSYDEKSSHSDDGAVIKPDRLQPPFLKLPGLKYCYEGLSKKGNDQFPFYCYLAAIPARPGDADRLADQLRAQLKRTFPDTPDTWEPKDPDTPDGLNIHWRMIRVEGEQPFYVKSGGQAAPQNLPGIFELWMHDADDFIVLVGWRTPKAIEGPSPTPFNDPFDRPPNVQPDLSVMPFKTAGTLKVHETE